MSPLSWSAEPREETSKTESSFDALLMMCQAVEMAQIIHRSVYVPLFWFVAGIGSPPTTFAQRVLVLMPKRIRNRVEEVGQACNGPGNLGIDLQAL